jgi:hypothetical protein
VRSRRSANLEGRQLDGHGVAGPPTSTSESLTESTYQPVASMEESSPSRQRSLATAKAKLARLAMTCVIGPMVPEHRTTRPGAKGDRDEFQAAEDHLS